MDLSPVEVEQLFDQATGGRIQVQLVPSQENDSIAVFAQPSSLIDNLKTITATILIPVDVYNSAAPSDGVGGEGNNNNGGDGDGDGGLGSLGEMFLYILEGAVIGFVIGGAGGAPIGAGIGSIIGATQAANVQDEDCPNDPNIICQERCASGRDLARRSMTLNRLFGLCDRIAVS